MANKTQHFTTKNCFLRWSDGVYQMVSFVGPKGDFVIHKSQRATHYRTMLCLVRKTVLHSNNYKGSLDCWFIALNWQFLESFRCCCIKMMMHRGGKIDHQKWHPSQQLHCGVHSQWALSDHIPLCYRASAWHTSIFSPWLEGPGPPRIKPASRFYPAWIIRKR